MLKMDEKRPIETAFEIDAAGRKREEARAANARGMHPAQELVAAVNVLPLDSAARKHYPIASGCFDYFHAALAKVAGMPTPQTPPVAAIEFEFLEQSDGWRERAAIAALTVLQIELQPTQRIATLGPLVDRFGDALAAIANGSWVGNEKHNPGLPLHHSRGKSADHADCALRHLKDRGGWDVIKTGDGREFSVRHSVWLAWRCFALLQEFLESQGAKLARAARLPEVKDACGGCG